MHFGNPDRDKLGDLKMYFERSRPRVMHEDKFSKNASYRTSSSSLKNASYRTSSCKQKSGSRSYKEIYHLWRDNPLPHTYLTALWPSHASATPLSSPKRKKVVLAVGSPLAARAVSPARGFSDMLRRRKDRRPIFI